MWHKDSLKTGIARKHDIFYYIEKQPFLIVSFKLIRNCYVIFRLKLKENVMLNYKFIFIISLNVF